MLIMIKYMHNLFDILVTNGCVRVVHVFSPRQ